MQMMHDESFCLHKGNIIRRPNEMSVAYRASNHIITSAHKICFREAKNTEGSNRSIQWRLLNPVAQRLPLISGCSWMWSAWMRLASPIAGVDLSSVHKFLALGVLEPGFEVSEPASEETAELILFVQEEGSGFRRLEGVRGIGSDALNFGRFQSFGDR